MEGGCNGNQQQLRAGNEREPSSSKCVHKAIIFLLPRCPFVFVFFILKKLESKEASNCRFLWFHLLTGLACNFDFSSVSELTDVSEPHTVHCVCHVLILNRNYFVPCTFVTRRFIISPSAEAFPCYRVQRHCCRLFMFLCKWLCNQKKKSNKILLKKKWFKKISESKKRTNEV